MLPTTLYNDPLPNYLDCVQIVKSIVLDVREQGGAAQHIGAIDDDTMRDIISRILVVVGAD